MKVREVEKVRIEEEPKPQLQHQQSNRQSFTTNESFLQNSTLLDGDLVQAIKSKQVDKVQKILSQNPHAINMRYCKVSSFKY